MISIGSAQAPEPVEAKVRHHVMRIFDFHSPRSGLAIHASYGLVALRYRPQRSAKRPISSGGNETPVSRRRKRRPLRSAAANFAISDPLIRGNVSVLSHGTAHGTDCKFLSLD